MKSRNLLSDLNALDTAISLLSTSLLSQPENSTQTLDRNTEVRRAMDCVRLTHAHMAQLVGKP